MHQINGLLRYMSGIERELDIYIIIKDFIGFLSLEPEIYNKLHPFCIHQSDYCMYIKSEQKRWDKCLYAKDNIQDKLNLLLDKGKENSFFGYCHGGVGEYIIPIEAYHHNKKFVVGAISIGGFKSLNNEILNKKFKAFVKNSIQNIDVLTLYEDSFINNEYELKDIKEKGQVISEYLGMLYEDQIQICLENKHHIEENHRYVVGNAMAYIKKRFDEDISLEEIADFCNCSHSFISHNFKKLTGKTIRGFINDLRTKKAKELLRTTKDSITSVGYQVGFKDGNYFSKVFKDEVLMSPKEYRKEVSYENK